MNLILVSCWLSGSALVAVLAKAKGYSGVLFFVLSVFASPLITFLAMCVAPSRGIVTNVAGAMPVARHLQCTRCSARVLSGAVCCVHCGALVRPRRLSAEVVRLSSAGD